MMARWHAARTFARPAADADYANLLVPLDGSDLAEAALGPARGLAQRFGAELHTVTGVVRPDERWWYERYLDRLRASTGRIETHLSTDRHVAAGIAALARRLDPCLLCMATHGRSRSAGLVGSTFSHVVAFLGQPVLAVGPRCASGRDPPLPDRVIACLDGGPGAEQVLPIVAAWARRLGARVTLVTAADPLLMRSRSRHEKTAQATPYPPAGDPDAYLGALAALPVLDGLVVEHAVLWGLAEPAVTVGEHLDSRRATIAAVATRARTGLARMALGSTAARVVRRSPVPVLVVPAPPGR